MDEKYIKTRKAFSAKAEKYAKYRWDYAAKAINEIVEITNLSANSSIADIGAGTGMLTKHFVGKVQSVYAIEPNVEMRQILESELGDTPSVSVLAGSAEATTLPPESVDVITVAQSIHWFDPEPAKKEMQRILRANGWLVLLRNYATGELNNSVSRLMTEEYGANFLAETERPREKPAQFYFGHAGIEKRVYPFQIQQTWEEFIGAITSASFMPNENHPLFNKFEREAKKIFSQYSNNGRVNGSLVVSGKTELIIGQPSRESVS